MLRCRAAELREGGGAFYLLGESEERRLSTDELRRVMHTLVDRVVLDPKTRELTVQCPCRLNFDHLFRLNFDQGSRAVRRTSGCG